MRPRPPSTPPPSLSLPLWQADVTRRAIHALNLQRVLVFMNFQQRLKDFEYKLEARGMQVRAVAAARAAQHNHKLCGMRGRGQARGMRVRTVAAAHAVLHTLCSGAHAHARTPTPR